MTQEERDELDVRFYETLKRISGAAEKKYPLIAKVTEEYEGEPRGYYRR